MFVILNVRLFRIEQPKLMYLMRKYHMTVVNAFTTADLID